jgi:UDP-glucose:(heptosyl)LPS alpha-1,3-glucosyltransferase
LRIGFQIEHLDPARGGAETYVYRLTEDLLAAGHEVHLFAGNFGKVPPGAYSHRILRRGLTRWERDLLFARAAETAVRHERLDVTVAVDLMYGADVLHPHGGTFLGNRRQNLLLLPNAYLRSLKGAFDAVNPRLRARLAIEAQQYAAEPPPEVVAVSNMVRRDVAEFYGVSDDRLHLIYNGVDVDRFSPGARLAKREEARQAWGLRPGQTCFLLVAHNFRLKGLVQLIEAAAVLDADPADWRILVVGRANPRPYQRRARRLGCLGRFLFAGAAADILPAYAAADAYVHPTWYDPCSLVVLEAMAGGLPVVTTRFNGASELMLDGREGFLLDTPRNTAALAGAMRALLDGGRRAEMGQAARATAEQYPLSRNFAQMIAVLERACARRRKEAAS